MAITINGNGTITGISAGGLPDGSVTAATLASGAAVPADGSITTAKLANDAVTHAKSTGLQRRIVTAVTLPTNALEITHNVTAGVKKIEVIMAEVSGTNNNNLHIQIGDSGGIETTNYYHAMGYHRSSSPGVSNSTGAFATYGLDAASYHIFGKWQLYNPYSNYWVSDFTLWGSDASNHQFWGTGYKNLSCTLTQFKFYMGSGNFDAGYLSIVETMGDD